MTQAFTHPLRAPALALALTLACLAGGAPRVLAQSETESPAESLAIRIEIEESVEGKAYPHLVATHFIRKKLRDVGFRAWSATKRPTDDKEHEAWAKKERDAGRTPPASLEDLKPAPALIIKGKLVVNFERTSTFYGADLAAVFSAKLELTITEAASGKVVAELASADEWGRQERKEARDQILSRIGMFGAVDVLSSEPIQSRLTDQGRKEAQAFIDKINKQRKGS